jgi:hypothetical protein
MKTEKSPNPVNLEYDYVIIGSGFGGSVCALRLQKCLLLSPEVKGQVFLIITGIAE